MTTQELIDAGYTRHGRTGRTNAAELFQKRFRFDGGTAYLLNVYRYDFSGFPNVPFAESFAPEVQFKGPTTNVEMLIDQSTTVAEVEAFYARVYAACEFEPYERY